VREGFEPSLSRSSPETRPYEGTIKSTLMLVVNVIVIIIVTYGVDPKAAEVEILVRVHHAPRRATDATEHEINRSEEGAGLCRQT